MCTITYSCPLWHESFSPYNVFPLPIYMNMTFHWPAAAAAAAAGSVTAAASDGGAFSCVDGASIAIGLFLSCSGLPFYLQMMQHKYDCRTYSLQILMPGRNTRSPHSSKCHQKFHWALLPDHSYCLSTKHQRYIFIQNSLHTLPLMQLVLGTHWPPVNWYRCEADHSLPPSAGVKNMWSYTSIPSHAFMAS